MKRFSIFMVFLAASLFFTSCEENKNVQFDGVNGQSLVAFTAGSADLPVNIDTGVGSVTVPIEISTVSTTDRTFSVGVVAADTDALASTYMATSSVTIPAGEYNANVVIDGLGADLVVGETKKIVLEISGGDADLINADKLSVNIFLVCPIPDGAFTGMYLIEQTSPFVDGPTLSTGTVVAVTAIDNDSRQFSTETYPQYCAGSFLDFQFDLVCGSVNVPNQDTICRCASVTDWFTPATTPEMYNVNDDSMFLLTFTDDTQNDCGAPAQTTYRFTKQ